MTSRGLVEKDFEQIAEFLHRAVTITLKIQKEHGKLLKDFNKGLVNNKDIEELKADVGADLVSKCFNFEERGCSVAEGVDHVFVRELTGGISPWKTKGFVTNKNGQEIGFNTEVHATCEGS